MSEINLFVFQNYLDLVFKLPSQHNSALVHYLWPLRLCSYHASNLSLLTCPNFPEQFLLTFQATQLYCESINLRSHLELPTLLDPFFQTVPLDLLMAQATVILKYLVQLVF